MFFLLLNALQVAAVTSVYLHEVALVHEQRHANLYASLQSGGLQGVGSGVALDSGL